MWDYMRETNRHSRAHSLFAYLWQSSITLEEKQWDASGDCVVGIEAVAQGEGPITLGERPNIYWWSKVRKHSERSGSAGDVYVRLEK